LTDTKCMPGKPIKIGGDFSWRRAVFALHAACPATSLLEMRERSRGAGTHGALRFLRRQRVIDEP
jgi:hypothetical protein